MNKYVISDIHGCFNELVKLIKKINPKKDDGFIFLGDYVDRGLDSKKVIEFLIALKKEYNCIFLKGNHEKMFLDFIDHPNMGDLFLYNGGHKTLKSYQDGGMWEIPDEHVRFLSSMKLWHDTEDYFFVHAGIPNKDLSKITEDDEDILLWTRDEFLNSGRFFEKTIVHGHTPTKDNKVEFADSRINIDTGCFFGGELSCLVLPEESVVFVQKDTIIT